MKNFYILIFLSVFLIIKSCSKSLEIEKSIFGRTSDGSPVYAYKLTNNNDLNVKLLEHGARIVSLKVPDKNNQKKDVVLGFTNLGNYSNISTGDMGAVLGRYANRIRNGLYTFNGKKYRLTRNDFWNHLHGGYTGFDDVIWESEKIESSDSVGVKFEYLSEDGEEGYPGNLRTTVKYILNNKNELKIQYKAETDKPTPVNLSNQIYFDLSGTQGRNTILGHKLKIYADKYTPINEDLTPTGEIDSVKETPLNFRRFKKNREVHRCS